MRLRGSIAALSALLVCSAVAQDAGSDEREARREAIRRSRALLSEALQEIEAGSAESAAAKLRSLVAEDPGNADGYFHLGRVFLAQGDTVAAVAVLEQGMERAPLSARIRLLFARQLLARGSAEEAATLLEDVMKVHARDGEALYLRGLAYLASGDSSAALAAWRRSLEIGVEDDGR